MLAQLIHFGQHLRCEIIEDSLHFSDALFVKLEDHMAHLFIILIFIIYVLKQHSLLALEDLWLTYNLLVAVKKVLNSVLLMNKWAIRQKSYYFATFERHKYMQVRDE